MRRFLLTLVLAFVGAVVFASAVICPAEAASKWYVNHELKQCVPYAGIGLGGGWVVADECPAGYQVPQSPEEPWYIKLLKLLDGWFGLQEKVVWLPSAKVLAGIASLVLVLRRFLQVFGGLFDKLTHGVGTLVLSAVVSFLVQVQPLLADGKLTVYEAVLALLTTVAGAAGVWEVLKRLVRKPA
jgi:hypothetical protein